MNALFSILGLAFSAFFVWLSVRIFNRREKWAIELAAIVFPWAVIFAEIYALISIWGWLMR